MHKSIKVEKWKDPNGNFCFRFPMRKIFERPWIIIFATLLVIAVCCLEFFIWGSYTLLVPLSIFLFLFFLWWIVIPARRNETIITKTVHEIMDSVVDKDAKALGAKVVKSQVDHDVKGTYGRVEASYFLVLLDNDEVWEYPIIYHKLDKQYAYFECERNHVVSDNQKHIHKINPRRWNRFIENLNLSEKTVLGLLLIAILLLGGLVFFGFCWVLDNYLWWSILIFVSYALFYCLIEWLYSRRPSKILNIIRFVISVPIVILYILLHAGLPFLTIVGTYFFLVLFAFGVPAIILIGASRLGWFVLKPETIAFVVFAIGSILCSNSYKTTKWIIQMTPLKDWGNHNYEAYREKLAIYLIHPSNVTFLLYFIYFVFLCISGFLQIEEERYLISNEFDSSILKAFLVFIAFTNMRTKAKFAEVDVKELFQQTLKLFVHDE